MRHIETYILRLLIDQAEPEAMRGALQRVPEGAAQAFASEQALVALLHQLLVGATCLAHGESAAAENETTGKETGT